MNYKLTFILLSFCVFFTSCETEIPLDDVTTNDFYGAWVSTDYADVTKVMLCMENNTVYTNAPSTNAWIMLNVTATDTVVVFAGSYVYENQSLITSNASNQYANVIKSFTKNKFVLATTNLKSGEATYTRTTSTLMTKKP